MKKPLQNNNYFKNNYYRFKIEPFESSQCDYLDESEFKKLNDANDSNYLLKLKINPKFYTFFVKSEQVLDEHVVVDIDDYVMTIMQLYNKEDSSKTSRENLLGFAHSFAIPESIILHEIKLYAKGNILLIVIPRL